MGTTINSIELSPNDKLLGVTSHFKNIIIWNLQKNELFLNLTNPHRELNSNASLTTRAICWSRDSKFFYTCGDDQHIRKFDLTGTELANYHGHSALIWQVKHVRKYHLDWQFERLLWIGFKKSPGCVLSLLPKEILKYLIEFCV